MDSWIIDSDLLNHEQKKFMKECCVHYLCSELPKGTQETQDIMVCPHVSTGHPRHEYTPGYAWPLIKHQFLRGENSM